MTVLAIETSCDETGVAIVRAGQVRANVVASQVPLHTEYGGVVPELATREHLRNLAPLVQAAFQAAGVSTAQVETVAATRGPGLPSALLVGMKAAAGLAFASRKPLYGINHHEAHLYSPWIGEHPTRADFTDFAPNVALIVSGWHTLLVSVPGLQRHEVLGSTMDDAAGECFDKTAKLIGLCYPGGPQIERLAAGGNPRAYAFPRPLLAEPHDDFSFSGLKTAVRYYLRDHPNLLDDPSAVRDLCASVQAAIVQVLVTKTIRAAQRVGVRTITVSGGVACNRCLRAELMSAAAGLGLTVRFARPEFCTDNAAMVGVLAELQARHGMPPTDLDADVEPGWTLR